MSGASLVAVAAGSGLALLIIGALAVRRVRSRRGRRLPAASLARLDYLPPVTIRAPRLRWHGSRYWTVGRAVASPAPAEKERELVGVRAAQHRARHSDDHTGPE